MNCQHCDQRPAIARVRHPSLGDLGLCGDCEWFFMLERKLPAAFELQDVRQLELRGDKWLVDDS